MEKKIMVKLVSIASVAKSQTNAQGKVSNFYPCTVEFKTPSGELVQRSGRVFEGNLKYGMEVGTEYSATARVYVDADNASQVDIQVSHLTGAARATLDDFGFALVPTTSAVDFTEGV
jgi:hypothetical protein